MKYILSVLFLLCAAPAFCQDAPDVVSMQIEPKHRNEAYNTDGSCVQCSLVMCGFHCNDPVASCLLWDTKYGPAVRGGSWPARVANYCNDRGIKAWNVTGYEHTEPWMRWAVKTGRFAAIGASRAHFQTLYGYDYKSREWLVCNNQTPKQIDRYSEAAFKQLHLASGPWIVVLKKPSSETPILTEWWK